MVYCNNFSQPAWYCIWIFCVTSCQDRYKLMYGLNAYSKWYEILSNKVINGGEIPLLDDYTTDSSVSFCGINGICTWLKLLASSFSWCFYVHKNKIKELFLLTLQRLHKLLDTLKRNVIIFWQILEVNGMWTNFVINKPPQKYVFK